MLVYAIIGFFLFFVMRALGELLLSNLEYKSFRDFADDILGPWAGFVTGWTYWITWIIVGMADLVGITGYVLWWWPNCPRFLPALVALAIMLAINLATVRLFGELEFWFSFIKVAMIAILILLAVGLVVVGFDSSNGSHASFANLLNTDHGGWFPNGTTGFLAGFQIAFFAFAGMELVGTAATETKDPRRTLPKAINSIPIRVGLFYILSLAGILAVTPWSEIDPEISPFVNMFSLAGLGVAAGLVNFVVVTSAASSMNSGVFSTSRMLYGLSTSHKAPRVFGLLSSQRVPANALVFSVCCTLPAIGLLYASDSIMNAFTYASTTATVLFIFVWSIILVSYLVYRRRRPELHQASVYKMPLGVPMCYILFGFFAVSLVILGLDRDTLAGEAFVPLWFLVMFVAWRVYQSRRLGQRATTKP
jgi:D-serine/D-alanine/glycine transporter